ncbi:MAG: ATP synthase subunit B [Simkaniaceae bacterium]
MQIDWFTVVAQIVNFLILAALLHHFLFKRIIKAMDNREQRIIDRVEEAKKEKEQAEEERKKLQQKNKEFDQQKDAMYSNAEKQIEEQKNRWKEQAKEEIKQQKEKWLEELEKQQQEFYQKLKEKIGEQTYTISKDLIKNLADEDLESRIIENFIKQLQSLESQQKEGLIKAYEGRKEENIHINSAFVMKETYQKEIKEILEKLFSSAPKIDFSVDPQLILGISLKCNGVKIGWTAKDYFRNLEEDFTQLLEKKERS